MLKNGSRASGVAFQRFTGASWACFQLSSINISICYMPGPSQRHLRSVCQNELMVTRHKLSSAFGLACFRCRSLVGLEFSGRSCMRDAALELNSSCLHTTFRLRNDLYCVEWGVKLYSLTHLHTTYRARPYAIWIY